MILVEGKGTIQKTPEVRDIQRDGMPGFKLAVASVEWTVMRGEREVRMFIDLEAVGDKAWELADLPLNMEFRFSGNLERHAWKDKQTDQWRSKHVIKYQASEVIGQVPEQEQAGESDLPF